MNIPLLDEYLHYLADGEGGAFAPDVVLDMNVPSWRFQVQGLEEVTAVRKQAGGHWDVHLGAAAPTPAGFVAETSYDSIENGQAVYTRSINLVTVRDGLITEVIHYCTGPQPGPSHPAARG